MTTAASTSTDVGVIRNDFPSPSRHGGRTFPQPMPPAYPNGDLATGGVPARGPLTVTDEVREVP
jgi:hypothetical protein